MKTARPAMSFSSGGVTTSKTTSLGLTSRADSFLSHWYLKQCIEAAAVLGEEALQSIFWNPESPLSLYLVGSKAFECHVYHWDTFAAEHAAPEDSGAVAVVDGCTYQSPRD